MHAGGRERDRGVRRSAADIGARELARELARARVGACDGLTHWRARAHTACRRRGHVRTRARARQNKQMALQIAGARELLPWLGCGLCTALLIGAAGIARVQGPGGGVAAVPLRCVGGRVLEGARAGTGAPCMPCCAETGRRAWAALSSCECITVSRPPLGLTLHLRMSRVFVHARMHTRTHSRSHLLACACMHLGAHMMARLDTRPHTHARPAS